MPNTLTLPAPESEFARCPHCGASVKIDKVWYQKLVAILAYLNSL